METTINTAKSAVELEATPLIGGIWMTDMIIEHLAKSTKMSIYGIKYMISNEEQAVVSMLAAFPLDLLKLGIEERLNGVTSLSGRSFRITFEGAGELVVNEILAKTKAGGSPQRKEYTFTAGLYEFTEGKHPLTLEVITAPTLSFKIWAGHIVSEPEIPRSIMARGTSITGATEMMLRSLGLINGKTEQEVAKYSKSGYVQFKDCPLINLK